MKLAKLTTLVLVILFLIGGLTAIPDTANNNPKSEGGSDNVIFKKPSEVISNNPAYSDPLPATRGARYLEKDFLASDAQLIIYGGNSDDLMGYSVDFGDIDNDGYEDMIIGAPYADGTSSSVRSAAGEVIIKFGHAGQTNPGTMHDIALDDYDMIIYGRAGSTSWQDSGDLLGFDLASGDVNGDGYDDIVMGAPAAQFDSNRRDGGAVFVIFGDERSKLPDSIDLAAGADFVIYGSSAESQAGRSVATGDFDKDGFDDILLGEPYADPGSRTNAGRTFVVMGSSGLSGSEDLTWNRQSASTIQINGHKARNGNGDPGDQSGFSVAAGDFNGDNYDDIIIGARSGQLNNGRLNAGAVYVIQGGPSMSSDYNLATDARANIWGSEAWDYAGQAVASADIDGDDLDDILITAVYGDGLSNGKSNAGEMYIVYGSLSLAQNINLRNEYDVAIWGLNVNDWLGEGLAVGDINGDEYMDFAVGARLNDASTYNINDAGAAYIFQGDKRSEIGTGLDLINDAVMQVYGKNESDQAGFTLAMGDFDNDSADDIAVVGINADGPVGARNSCGEIYMVYGKAPPMTIDSVELLDSKGKKTDTIYSKYDTYTFRVNVTDIIGAVDFSEAVLTLDPDGEDIQYKFDKITSGFTKQKDTNGLTTIHSEAADAAAVGLYQWQIDFNVEIDWEYPNSGLLPVEISAKGVKSLESTVRFSDVFQVEDDLEFAGSLEVWDEEGTVQNENGWVAGGETIAFRNLKVVYEGTTDVYAPGEEFTVTVTDDIDAWTNDTATGMPIYVDATLKPNTNPEDAFIVAITSPPTESAGAFRYINLSVDGEAPTPPASIEFKRDSSDLSPITAVNSTSFFAKWAEGGDKFSGIRGYYYALENNGGTDQGLYTANLFADIIGAPEGIVNVYIWSVDNAGNIGTASSNTIFVDLDNIEYSKFEPTAGEWQITDDFKCSIIIDDFDGSGIDTGTIRYKVSTRGLTGYESWLTVTDVESLDDNQVKASVDIKSEFLEGEDNYIKFKASDFAGNTLISADFNVKLDITEVEYHNEEPVHNSKQSETDVVFTITITDAISDIDTSSVEYKLATGGPNLYGAWTRDNMFLITEEGSEEFGMRYRVDLTLLPGKNNYIKFRAMDTAGNGYTESADYQIWVNTAPSPVISEPETNAGFKVNKDISFSAAGTSDADNDTLTYKWRSSIDGDFGFTRVVSMNKLSEGVHEITLEVTDGIATERSQITVIVRPKDSGSAGGGVFGESRGVNIAAFLIMLIIIILIFFLFIQNRKKLKEKESDLAKAVSADLLPGAMGAGAGLPGAGAAGPSLQPGYGGAAQQQYPQLPGEGAPMGGAVYDYGAPTAAGGAAGAPAAGGVQTGVVTPARPQLPPAFAQEYPHLDNKQKMDLLEEKFLQGQISENLYRQLKDKYQREVVAESGLEGPVITAEPVTAEPVTPTVTPGQAPPVPRPGAEIPFKKPRGGVPIETPPSTEQPGPEPDWGGGGEEDVLSRIQIPGQENGTGRKVKKIKKQ